MTDRPEPAVRTDLRWTRLALRLWPFLPGDWGLRLFRWTLLRANVEAQYPDRPAIPLGAFGDHVDD